MYQVERFKTLPSVPGVVWTGGEVVRNPRVEVGNPRLLAKVRQPGSSLVKTNENET